MIKKLYEKYLELTEKWRKEFDPDKSQELNDERGQLAYILGALIGNRGYVKLDNGQIICKDGDDFNLRSELSEEDLKRNWEMLYTSDREYLKGFDHDSE